MRDYKSLFTAWDSWVARRKSLVAVRHTVYTMDENQVTPPAEEIAKQTGSLESIEAETPETKKEAETVPLATYLALKDDMKEMKKKVKELENAPKAKRAEWVEELASKYGVDESFIEDMLAVATRKASQEIESKYVPEIEALKNERTKETFDKKFDTLYDSELAALKEEWFTIPNGVDKETIKALAIANKKVPIRDLFKRLYPQEPQNKVSAENDTRPAMDIVGDVVDVHNLSKEQQARILADPKARQKYFDMLDWVR